MPTTEPLTLPDGSRVDLAAVSPDLSSSALGAGSIGVHSPIPRTSNTITRSPPVTDACLHRQLGTTVGHTDMGSHLGSVVILAHQGGWDEFLMVAAPIIAFALLLRSANRRLANSSEDVKHLLESDDDEQSAKPRGLI